LSAHTRAIRTKENLEQIADFVSDVQVIPFAETMHVFTQERVRLWDAGQRIEDFDLLIGCAAKAKGLTMVTHNANHFDHIEGLAIEDWVK
jgi:tRNA(fMet)-specific endonuclease VapC